MTQHPLTDISAYADGELPAQEMARIERHLAECTECARELALIKSMGAIMAGETRRRAGSETVWPSVHRRLTQPIGWILVAAGVAVWASLATVEWFRAGTLTPEWLATTAIGIGLALIAVAIGHQQYREWRESPYKDVDK